MKKILDDVYVGSLLHDLGKVVIEFIHPRLLDSIKRFSIGRGISAEMFERFSIGLHHAEIGARIAEHWQFPDKLIAAIRFHHEPDQSDSSLHDLVFTIYLANSFCNFEKESLTFEQIDPNVLKYFKIYEKEQLDKLHNRLRTSFEKMQ